MTERRAVLTLGPATYAVSVSPQRRLTVINRYDDSISLQEYEAICKRYEVDILPVAELIGHASVTKAVADAVAARAAAGKPPYAAFIWFFEPWASAPFDENMLSPLTKSGCRLFWSINFAWTVSFCLPVPQSGAGAGYDVVDNAWLKTQGAYYCNTPTAFSVSTANGALMLILAATRAASHGDLNARAGKWRGNAAVPGNFLPLGQDIEGMTLGIIGFGSIGKALAVRAQACGMKIIYYNRRRVSESGKIIISVY
jgi:hypothetical protein